MQKILLVEDNDQLRSLYKEMLEKKSYTIDTAPNATTAYEKLETYKPDIIILDIMLPDTNGVEILEEIKSRKQFRRTPVLMLTGVSEIKQMQKCLQLGAAGYVLKGSSIEDLSRKISLVLNSFGGS